MVGHLRGGHHTLVAGSTKLRRIFPNRSCLHSVHGLGKEALGVFNQPAQGWAHYLALLGLDIIVSGALEDAPFEQAGGIPARTLKPKGEIFHCAGRRVDLVVVS